MGKVAGTSTSFVAGSTACPPLHVILFTSSEESQANKDRGRLKRAFQDYRGDDRYLSTLPSLICMSKWVLPCSKIVDLQLRNWQGSGGDASAKRSFVTRGAGWEDGQAIE